MVVLGLLPSASPPGVGADKPKTVGYFVLRPRYERVIGHSYHSDTTFYSTGLWKSREKNTQRTDPCYQLFLFAPECPEVYSKIVSAP
jgi:hypothetical protein